MQRTTISHMFLGSRLAGSLALALIGAPAPCSADPIADFYHGKVVQIFVGAAASGGYDLVSRAIASRLGQHLPGNPGVIVQNMPAASGLVMTNYLYNRAPRDGTAIGMPPNAIALEPRLKVLTRAGGAANFDIAKLGWLGTAARLPQILFITRDAGIASVEDLKSKTVVIGALSPGSDSYVLPVALNNMLGLKVQIVPGYEGQGDAFSAMERGEVHGHNGSFAGLAANKPDWLRDGFVRVLVQFGRERLPQLPEAPTAIELAQSPLDKAAMRFYADKYEIAYALVTPPETPADRVEALRAAFEETMQDPTYIAASTSIAVPVNWLDGRAVNRIIEDIQSAPQEVVDRTRALMIPGAPN